MEPGDAMVFNHRTLHKAYPNNAGIIRQALSLRFLGDGAHLTTQVINATPPFDRMGLKYNDGDPIPENWFPRLR
jgi:ectoine hydroxylase-related dioxygenase (phytanoyl-CoA dioxygenase family)